MNSPEESAWKDAIFAEMKSLIENDTWELVLRPPGKVIGCRTVLRNKFNADGSLEKKEARVVAQGFSQRPGVDYHETFAPVASLKSLRILASLSAMDGMKIAQLDVSTAYLNGHIDVKIHMELPVLLRDMLIRLIAEEKSSPLRCKAGDMLALIESGDYVCELKRALYGLKQSGRQWNIKLVETLKKLGFVASNADPCLFYNPKRRLYLLAYVDDFLIAYYEEAQLQAIKDGLGREFKMKDLGMAKFCLGIELEQRDDGIRRQHINVTRSY